MTDLDNDLACCLLATAERAARAAGAAHLGCRQAPLAVDRLMAHDVKLEADRRSEAAALEIIRADWPQAPIFSEEAGEIAGTGEFYWLLDPLDGTMNYFCGQHHFCACVAVYRCPTLDDLDSAEPLTRLGRPVAGAVFAPVYGEMFLGLAGQGATLNGRPLRAASDTDLAQAVIGTSFGSHEATMQHMEKIISRLLRVTRKLRIQGSCGLDLAQIAAGRLGGLFQCQVRAWDFAAARIIIEEAGGKIAAVETAPTRWNVLGAAPGLFAQLRAIAFGTF